MSEVDFTEVGLRGKLAYFNLEEATEALSPLLSATARHRFRIDLGAVRFVSPAGMALLRCAMKRCQELRYFDSGSRVLLPHSGDVTSYVQRMDVLDGLVHSATTEEHRRRRAPVGFVPMESFGDEKEAGSVAVRIVDSFELDSSVAIRVLQLCLCEITENAIYHSGVGEGSACAQKWSKGVIECAIADHGMGVAESMRQNPRHASLGDDPDVLKAALEQGGSGVDNRRRGLGLWAVSQAVERNGGCMTIRSGEAVYRQEGALPGTLVAMRFNLEGPLDISDILRSVPEDDDGFFISFEG